MAQLPGQFGLFEFLTDNYTSLPEAPVKINGVINTKSEKIGDISVQSTYRDIFLIINMLDDYAVMLRQSEGESSTYTNYMISQFERISRELSEQIELDKQKMYKKCQKRNEEPDDVGEEAMALGAKQKEQGRENESRMV